MKTLTRDEFANLLNEANVKPRLKRELRFVPEEITNWEIRDFLAVTTKGGGEGVLIVPHEHTYVVPFQLQRRRPNDAGRTEAIICDICATWQRGSNSAIITFFKEKSSMSYLCCADLLCSLHVRDLTPASTLSRTQLREHNTTEDRIERLLARLQQILSNLDLK
ncbi:MAG TPA: FBP domain-containing protein [Candidatus Saccharimonadales bacterium]|nr:FBP domain-containing protein [Candidatus Saccharimonadales bacterium]